MNSPTSRAHALINALNDRSRTTIGNPWNGTYHVAIDITNHGDIDELLRDLQGLGVIAQVNVGSVDRIAIYDLPSLEKLLGLGDALDDSTRKRLDRLVRAKGPVPERVVLTIASKLSMGLRPGQIAADFNQKHIPDGMGGLRWNATKVMAAYKGKVPPRLRKREAA